MDNGVHGEVMDSLSMDNGVHGEVMDSVQKLVAKDQKDVHGLVLIQLHHMEEKTAWEMALVLQFVIIKIVLVQYWPNATAIAD
jgi:hypothetical protein